MQKSMEKLLNKEIPINKYQKKINHTCMSNLVETMFIIMKVLKIVGKALSANSEFMFNEQWMKSDHFYV